MRLPDFVTRAREMIKTLMEKAYDIRLIKKKLSTFYDKYYNMVCNYRSLPYSLETYRYKCSTYVYL